MSTITIHTDNLRGHVAPLYRRYPQQSQPQPQPAYITITEDGDVSAGHSGEDTSMLAEVWTADAWLWGVNDLLDVWQADETLDAAVKRLEDQAAGAGVVIDGNIRESLLDMAARMHERGERGLSREHIDALVADGRITRADADAY